MKWQGSFPLWTATNDGRRIIECGHRVMPLPLVLGHDGRHIGSIQTFAASAWKMGARIRLEGAFDPQFEEDIRVMLDSPTKRARPDTETVAPIHLYLAPDLADCMVVNSGKFHEMSGRLIGCHVFPEANWPLQTSMTVSL